MPRCPTIRCASAVWTSTLTTNAVSGGAAATACAMASNQRKGPMKPTLEQWKRIVSEMRHEHDTGDGHFSTEEVLAVEEFVADLEEKQKENWATGAEIKDFWDNGWSDDYFSEDNVEPIQDELGSWLLDDNTMYNLEDLGLMIYQGRHDPESRNKTF